MIPIQTNSSGREMGDMVTILGMKLYNIYLHPQLAQNVIFERYNLSSITNFLSKTLTYF